jgi:hypothetical protein
MGKFEGPLFIGGIVVALAVFAGMGMVAHYIKRKLRMQRKKEQDKILPLK